MGLVGYTNIKPSEKYGTYGYNVGLITLLLKDTEVNTETRKIKRTFNLSLSNFSSCILDKTIYSQSQTYTFTTSFSYELTNFI
jgi:hypothetical protein